MIKNILLFTFLTFLSNAAITAEDTTAESRELIIDAKEVQIAGTLVVPNKKQSERLIIMLSGSGPQDRDETLDGFKVFKSLSRHLTSQGIANFRFDDRGVDQSTGNFPMSTLEDHSNDVKAIMAFFMGNSSYSYREFILLGHSQGGIVAANVAVESPQVKQLILMGAPAVPLIDIVLYQLRQEHLDNGVAADITEKLVSAHNRLMRAIRDQSNITLSINEVENVTQTVLKLSSANAFEESEKLRKTAQATAQELKIIYGLPSLTSFLYHDSYHDFQNLQVPVLSLFGGKDLQVTIAQNKDRMEQAMLDSGVTYEFVTFENANHYFQKAVTGQRIEYEQLDKEFIDGFLSMISDWILRP